MYRLNLPEFNYQIRINADKTEILDVIRRRYVTLTPEEWVRQHFIHLLIEEKKIPAGLIAVEKALKINNRQARADIVVHDRHGIPWMIVECKSPEVALSPETIYQAGRYNLVLSVNYLLITNGLQHMVYHYNQKDGSIVQLREIPEYD